MSHSRVSAHRRSLSTLATLGMLLVSGAPATAGDVGRAEPVAAMNAAGRPAWTPHVRYERLTLRVSGPEGLLILAEFPAGRSPALDEALPDGRYQYELRTVPVVDRDVRALLRLARETGEDSIVDVLRAAGRLPTVPVVQTGSFEIRGGALVDPSAVE